MEDGVLKRLIVGAASRAGDVGVFGPPGGVSGKVTFVSAHLVYSSCDKLIQANERMRVEASRVCVVVGRGVEGVPFAQHLELGTNLQDFVGACHKERGGDFFPSQGWYLKNKGETGEAVAQRNGEVSECVDREVFAHGGGGDRSPPV